MDASFPNPKSFIGYADPWTVIMNFQNTTILGEEQGIPVQEILTSGNDVTWDTNIKKT